MKKYFYLAAVSAMMLTACSSDKDVLQPTPEPSTPQVVAQQQAVGFDVYVPAATASTRSGRTNVMDNSTLQTTGFGVFGYQVDGAYNSAASGGSTPNYMWNQQVNYISNAWGYSPLKYWPNETGHDSQSTSAGMPTAPTGTNVDQLTFFAYAPWVKGTPATGVVESVYPNEAPAPDPSATPSPDPGAGIVSLPTNATAGDPKIHYVVATNPSQSVDLLWGVAPVGDLVYTAVDGSTKRINEGMPLIDLKKPAVNTSMKFLFQHALARLGVKVVLAADQVSAGGNFDVANSKVTIEEIAITGNFGSVGDLNLNNTVANKAEWEGVTTAAASSPFVINATNGLAAHLRYDATVGPSGSGTFGQQTVTGVTTQYSDAIQVSNIPGYSKSATTPGYSATVPYFASATAHEGATPAYAAYTAGTNNYAASTDSVYLQKNVLSGAYTQFTPSLTYPNATVWSNIYSIANADLLTITAANQAANKNEIAYRKHGNTYYPTGQAPLVGEYVFKKALQEVTLGTTAGTYYLANSNYFMVIPPTGETPTDKKIKVKITYYVSTTDPNVAGGVVYTKNEVEKEIELPHFKNGVAYNLKLILGMTSVKLEAEAADWVTTTSEIYLPQNTAE